ncbi:Gfo/Idh/MocA family protein [Cellulomonas phragmiteti]|uniref:Oxidoreductase n=1 Tax=Cellulomonas phragmiteti TaxID=478780 RepID=A0ABQ4DNV7_9CELL|nr:Gfo/Idh/MocA family oxidoreductase [Cellulomonas phragmiteti]GIG41029.1 oxidoreductase [Cellulomonas phragmiteti]
MLTIGVVGTGGIASAHLAGYAAFPQQCRVVALHDAVASRAHDTRSAHGLDGADVVGWEELLARQDVDLVSVCTPPSTHRHLTVDLLRSGKNVLVEKPMAPSVADCDAMLAAAHEAGKQLGVVAQNRFRDDLAVVKETIDSGLLGPVAHVRVDSAWWRGTPYYDLDWRGTWRSEGGGPTLNHAIHHVDLLLWMLGAPERVTAVMTNAWHDNSEVEDLSVALLEWERTIATLTASVVHHGEEQAFAVQGRDAAVAQPWSVRAEAAQPNGFPARGGDAGLVASIEQLAADRAPLAHEGHAGQIGDLLAALVQGRAPAITGEDGRRTVEVVTAVYQAAIERRPVDLPLDPASPWYTGEALLARAPRYHEKTRAVASQEGVISLGGSPGPVGPPAPTAPTTTQERTR